MTYTKYTTLNSSQILKEFKLDFSTGLTNSEVKKLQKEHGLNEIKSKEIKWWQIFARQFKSAFIYLLIASSVLALILGELTDGVMILMFVLINAFLGFYQEHKSEKMLKILKEYVVSRARVMRDGKEEMVESKELVPGDLVILEPGDIVPADIRVIEENNLMVNESVLTGESVPVKKNSFSLKEEAKEIYQSENILFLGTSVVSGKAKGVVIFTGSNTTIGDITKLTVETKRVSNFEKQIKSFSNFILRLILITLVFIFIANIFVKKGQLDIIELVIFSIALAVSVIPEGLPVVTIFSLSRGAVRLAKNKVVAKRLSAIEDLGCIDILCTDKTGTITENKLTVAQVYNYSDNSADDIIFAASVCAPFLTEKRKEPNNAFDLSLWNKLSEEERKKLVQYQRISEMPFDPTRRRNSVLVRFKGVKQLIVRGAVENILALCIPLKKKEKEAIFNWVIQEGISGRRVIAVAYKECKQIDCKNIEKEEDELELLGIISFADPLKPTAKEAIEQAKELGVQVKILTGDSKEVSGAIAKEVGLIEKVDKVITGEELFNLKSIEQHRAVEEYAVFARVSPQQKYHIIELLETKHAVGFLGEGINDAPALKMANVGIVVHEASDIAKEAADIILLHNSLRVIIGGIREGRGIFANTLKYIKSTLTSNIGNFYAVAIALFMIDYLPMLPIQLLLVNLLSDFPMIAIAADNVDEEEIKRPKKYDIKDIALFAVMLGLVSTIFDFILFSLFYKQAPEILHTYWFIGSILTELVFLFLVRTKLAFWKSRKPAGILFWLSLVAAFFTVFIPFTELGQNIFKFIRPEWSSLSLVLIVMFVYLVVTEIVKLLYYKFNTEHSS